MKRNNRKIVNPRFARGKKYKKVLHEIESVGVCPFCPKNFRWHTKPILKQSDDWFITENFNPYKNSQYHFVIINKKHKERFSELSLADWRNMARLALWAIKKFKIKGGGFALRFGDAAFTGATVCHIHAHVIVPKVKNKESVPVFFPIG
jgi:diadenosine tetraphosphate (Ap4A) HIT family hydrolase